MGGQAVKATAKARPAFIKPTLGPISTPAPLGSGSAAGAMTAVQSVGGRVGLSLAFEKYSMPLAPILYAHGSPTSR